jgi:hypothetical protein
MSSLPATIRSTRSGRRAAAVAATATALVAGIALLTPATGAGAQTPGSTPPAAPPPRVTALMVNPDTDLANGQEVTITAAAEMGAEGDIAYTYYLKLCAGTDIPSVTNCESLAGPLWPVNGNIIATVKLPAVINAGSGEAFDCRVQKPCVVVAHAYRSATFSYAPVSFAPPTAPPEQGPSPAPSTKPGKPAKPGTKPGAQPAKPVKSKPHYTG